MTKVILPPIGQKLVDDVGNMVKEWYDKIKFLEKLQPLSDIPPAAASVTSIDTATGDFTLGYGLSRSTQQLLAGLSQTSAALGSDVALNNTANYFDGPSISQGSTGTWFVTGGVVVTTTAGSADQFNAKLWDGTTVIASGVFKINAATINIGTITLAGVITSPAGNLKISVNDQTSNSGKIVFNSSGNSKDSWIAAVRIA